MSQQLLKNAVEFLKQNRNNKFSILQILFNMRVIISPTNIRELRQLLEENACDNFITIQYRDDITNVKVYCYEKRYCEVAVIFFITVQMW